LNNKKKKENQIREWSQSKIINKKKRADGFDGNYGIKFNYKWNQKIKSFNLFLKFKKVLCVFVYSIKKKTDINVCLLEFILINLILIFVK
jgi:hypothetical protein